MNSECRTEQEHHKRYANILIRLPLSKMSLVIHDIIRRYDVA